tara:strand:+ start:1195 stop:1671 length:477 start_codon:yes stop_codon:yes gene_type:complete
MNEHNDTTNISELPIVQTNSGTNNDEMMQNIHLSTEKRQHDVNSIVEKSVDEKRVRFQEKLGSPSNEPVVPVVEKSSSFALQIEHKVIVLATFFFFVFMDTKFKKYILNILVQIFGNVLKTEMNQMTKIGMFVYSLFYASVLLICVSLIDLTSFHLAF